jgi:imidazolonepropionase-like amidohydrolase
MLDYKIAEFKKQIAAGVPFAVGSDVGPFPHGTQARELTLMVKYGMTPLAVLQADMINGAKLLRWDGQIGELKPGYYADIIAVPGQSARRHRRRGTRDLRDEERRGGDAVITPRR